MKRFHLAICLTIAAASALSASAASAEVKTEKFRHPISVEPYQVKQETTFGVDKPRVDGFITGMSMDVVDANGDQIPIQRLMLHHIVFGTFGRQNSQCSTFKGWDSRTEIPALTEPFAAAGEERAVLGFPPGYGYRMRADDNWTMTWMVMNHRNVDDSAFIEWTVTYDTDPNLVAATPYWMDVRNCRIDPVYDVPGGGREGSTHRRTYELTVPSDGRIINGGGHVHGGGKSLVLSQPDCDNRTLYESEPTWGNRDHPFYNVKPVLHEPGPINMSGFVTAKGHPVNAGQKLRLTANYDNELPHTRVMGIMVTYIAHGEVPDGCQPLADDVLEFRGFEQGRDEPPRFKVPIVSRGSNGVARNVRRAPGRTFDMRGGGTIFADDFFFSKPNVVVEKGDRLRWRFGRDGNCADPLGEGDNPGCTVHNITLASGPEGFSSPNLNDGNTYRKRFTRVGKYKLFCGLHPADMIETVKVKKKKN